MYTKSYTVLSDAKQLGFCAERPHVPQKSLFFCLTGVALVTYYCSLSEGGLGAYHQFLPQKGMLATAYLPRIVEAVLASGDSVNI